MKNIILTGDRPTGKLHIGHYIGSLKNRVRLQNEGNYEKMYVMIADSQALTDNYDNPKKVRDHVIEVALDYLACGLDPKKCTFFIQSQVSELTELTFYYMNLVSVSRLFRNPTVKNEIALRGFEESIPAGFLAYPVSQTADITAFHANVVPVGVDQLPMLEQAREIVRKFNSIYGETLTEPKEILPEKESARRLPGIDGKAKMSKSLGNCIYLADSKEELTRKVMAMYTDPDHVRITDPGKIEGNVVFTYLDVFATDEHFKKYYPEFHSLEELKEQYQKGGVGDVAIKRFLNAVLEEELAPIRKRREELSCDKERIYQMLEEGSKLAREDAQKTLKEVKKAMMIDYFDAN